MGEACVSQSLHLDIVLSVLLFVASGCLIGICSLEMKRKNTEICSKTFTLIKRQR